MAGVRDLDGREPEQMGIEDHWQKHEARVKAFLVAATGDFHAAEDVLQEVAVAVLRKFSTYDQSQPFGPWVFGVARKCLASFFRKSASSRLVFDDDMLRDLSTSLLQISEQETDGQFEALKLCIRALKPDARQLVERRYLHSQRIADIAAHFEATVSATSVRLHRVRKTLAECINRRMRGSQALSVQNR